MSGFWTTLPLMVTRPTLTQLRCELFELPGARRLRISNKGRSSGARYSITRHICWLERYDSNTQSHSLSRKKGGNSSLLMLFLECDQQVKEKNVNFSLIGSKKCL